VTVTITQDIFVWWSTSEAFCQRPFALHLQKPEKEEPNVESFVKGSRWPMA